MILFEDVFDRCVTDSDCKGTTNFLDSAKKYGKRYVSLQENQDYRYNALIYNRIISEVYLCLSLSPVIKSVISH